MKIGQPVWHSVGKAPTKVTPRHSLWILMSVWTFWKAKSWPPSLMAASAMPIPTMTVLTPMRSALVWNQVWQSNSTKEQVSSPTRLHRLWESQEQQHRCEGWHLGCGLWWPQHCFRTVLQFLNTGKQRFFCFKYRDTETQRFYPLCLCFLLCNCITGSR